MVGAIFCDVIGRGVALELFPVSKVQWYNGSGVVDRRTAHARLQHGHHCLSDWHDSVQQILTIKMEKQISRLGLQIYSG